ncbi:MAG: transcription antitermination factor NusB [Bacteroidetes bacterium]|nr:transcription antitermination factor NusB [Bacteroidota bacterium]
MQNIYAFQLCQEANYQIVRRNLDKELSSENLNDLTENEIQEQKSLSLRQFEQIKNNPNTSAPIQISSEIKTIFDQAGSSKRQQDQRDFDHLLRMMLEQAEKIYDHGLSILLLLVNFSDFSREEVEKRHQHSYGITPNKNSSSLNFADNRVIQAIKSSSLFNTEVTSKKVSWEQVSVSQWYREILKKDPEYQTYLSLSKTNYETDLKLVKHILKNSVFKKGTIYSFLEEHILNWAEDREIIKSMVGKSLKTIDPDLKNSFHLAPLSYNWDDDKKYFRELFNMTIANNQQYDKLIAKKAKNWDLNRMAVLDKIIIKMAICEFINFPSIPIKVTINEYIEISKLYSTPKSKIFVNGIMDVLAGDLGEKGEIRKSGRGLLDNK